jgi:hypothetical protein
MLQSRFKAILSCDQEVLHTEFQIARNIERIMARTREPPRLKRWGFLVPSGKASRIQAREPQR